MQTNGHGTRVEAKCAAANQFVAAGLKTRHAKPVVVNIKPFDGKSVGDPRQKHRFDMTRERSEDIVNHIFWNARGMRRHGRISQRTSRSFAHGISEVSPLHEASCPCRCREAMVPWRDESRESL